LQQNATVPADNGGTTRNNLRGINPLFTNEASAIGADMMWATADDGLQLTSCNQQPLVVLPGNCSPAINTGDNTLVSGSSDLNNKARIVCSIVDRGAYENQLCAQIPALQREEEFTKLPTSSNNTSVVANPFNNDLQIRYMGTEKAAITVLSALGRAMFTGTNIRQGVTHVNASTWSSGFYEVVIIDVTGKRVNFKVMKL